MIYGKKNSFKPGVWDPNSFSVTNLVFFPPQMMLLDSVFIFLPQADIILWDYSKKEMLSRLSLHKGKIEHLAFSPNDLYLISLGGQDDGR